MTLTAVTYPVETNGKIQLARTGSGFWRDDHAKPFSIDKELLSLLLYNTQLRKRPLRMDFMHYANGKEGMPIEAMGKAGCVDPADITLEPWTEPNTETPGWALYAPSSFTGEGLEAVRRGINEISPVIKWQYQLPEDVLDPETGETVQAGTLVGPCITGLSLVDRGYFWMDEVKLYSEGGSMPHASLYQEYAMALPLEKLQTLIAQLIKAGFTQEEAAPILAAAMTAASKEEPKPADPIMPAKETAPAPAPAAPAVLAARMAPSAPAVGATLAELWKNAKAAQTPATPTGTGNYGEKIASVEERLSRIEASHDELMISDLERQGLLVGIPDARKLYREAPSYFMELVSKNTPLTTPASPAAANRPSGLRAIQGNAGLSAEDRFALEVKTYREGQAKNGRKIDQQTAIEEVELAQKQAAKGR